MPPILYGNATWYTNSAIRRHSAILLASSDGSTSSSGTVTPIPAGGTTQKWPPQPVTVKKPYQNDGNDAQGAGVVAVLLIAPCSLGGRENGRRGQGPPWGYARRNGPWRRRPFCDHLRKGKGFPRQAQNGSQEPGPSWPVPKQPRKTPYAWSFGVNQVSGRRYQRVICRNTSRMHSHNRSATILRDSW
jgi:hypothetical protein